MKRFKNISKYRPSIRSVSKLLKNRRKRVLALLAIILVLLPTALFTLLNSRNAEASWWSAGGGYAKRKRLTLTNTSSDSLASGTTVAVSVDTKELYDLSLMQSDCDDLRILYQPNSSTETELERYIIYPNNDTCATSTATNVYFKLQADLGSSTSSGDYYLYYGNSSASSPTATVDTFDIGSTNAMLICDFRGDLECVNGDGAESPTTETGALRDVGTKSAVYLDGTNDYLSAADTASLSVTGDLTIETWFKIKKVDAEQTIIGKWDETTATDDRSYRMYVTSGNKLAFSISSDGASGTVSTITGGTTLSVGTWYHATGVYDSSAQTLDIYLNGTSDATQVGSTGTSINNNASLLYIGGKENTSGAIDTNLLGIIDEIRISDMVRYTTNFTPPQSHFTNDENVMALYHFDESGKDPRNTNKANDASENGNHLSFSGGIYVSGYTGKDGLSDSGTHTGVSGSGSLTDSGSTWKTNEWVGYIIYNQTDGSHGTITSNTSNTIVATLTGGIDNQWETSDAYFISPDLGKISSQYTSAHSGVAFEEATTNKITNPSFEYGVFFGTNWAGGDSSSSVQTIITTTESRAVASYVQRKVWFDGTRYWAMTDDGTDLEFWYTTDGESWTQNASATISSRDYRSSIFGNSSVLYVVLDTGLDITIQKASSYPGTSFTWGSATTVFDGTGPTDAYNTPVVTIDSNGYIWAGATHFDSATPTGSFYVKRSTNTGDETAWNSASNLSASEAGLSVLGTIVPLDNGNMYAVFRGVSNLYGCYYDETTSDQWEDSSGNACSAGTNVDTIAIIEAANLSSIQATADTTNYDVHVTYEKDSDNVVYYNRWDNGSGTNGTWQTEASVSGDNIAFHQISMDTTTGDPYVIWVQNSSTNAKYSYCDYSAAGVSECNDAADWSSPTTFATLDATSSGGNFITSNLMDETRIFTMWRDDSASPYDIKAKILLKPSNPGSENTDPAYVKFGSKSAEVTGDGGDVNYVISIDPDSTATHTMSAYIYNGTSGEVGGTVDATVAQLLTEGTTQTTTYEDVGGGWWRLTYVDTSVSDAASNWGVQVKSGKIVYIDGVQLEEKTYATTYTDGSLGTGYSWSGTVNNSTSTRAAADLDYAVASNIQASSGSVSFWVNPNWDGDDGVEHTFFDVDTSAGSLRLYKTSGNVLTLTDGASPTPNTATVDISAWNKGEWHHIVADWGSSNMHVYVDTSAGTAAGAFSAPTLSTSMYVGQNKTNGAHANAVISDFRTFDAVLTSTQIIDLYYSDLVTFEEGYVVDRFVNDKGQDPVAIYHFDESYGTTAHDSSQYGNDLTISGTSWETQSVGAQSQRVRNLSFDGTNDYLVRDHDRDFNFDTEGFTVAGWFRHPSTVSGTDTIIARFNTAGWKVYMDASGFVCFGIDDDSTWGPDDSACDTVSRADSQWHHFEAVKDGVSSITLYIDGKQVAQDASLSATATLSANANMYVGIDSDGSSNPWAGNLDEIVIYPYARDASQVKEDLLGNQLAAVYGVSTEDFLTEGLVGYWKMDDNVSGNGQTITDYSGNGNNGTTSDGANDTGMDCTGMGKFGNGCNFDGTDDLVNAGSGSSLDNLSNNDFSVSAWIYPENLFTDAGIISKESGGSDGWSFRKIQDDLAFIVPGATNANSRANNVLTQSQWQHITAIYFSSERIIKLYINGDEVIYNEQDQGGGTLSDDSSYDLRLGFRGFGDYFDGVIDETRIYNRSLSPAEVKTLYEWAPGPTGYWTFDEGEGSTANDVSGNGNSGTFTGTVNWARGVFGSGVDTNTASSGVVVTDPSSGVLDFDATSDFTWMGWVKTNSSGTSDVFIQKGSIAGSAAGYRARIDTSGNASCGVSNAADADTHQQSGTTAINDGEWHHVACVDTYTGDASPADRRLRIYVDGVLESDTTHSEELSDTADEFEISQINAGSHWKGQIDEVKTYNYQRTPLQIVQDMNAGHPAPGSPIGSSIATWRFDEGYGTTANDASGNANELTLSSASWTNSGKYGKAWSGTGSNWLARADDVDFDFGANEDFSISMWVKSASDVNPVVSQTLVNKRVPTNNPGYNMTFTTSGRVSCNTDDDTSAFPEDSAVTTNDFYDGNWHHVVCVRNTNTLTLDLYIDGLLTAQDENLSSTGDLSNNDTLTIGDDNETDDGNEFQGYIDEVSIYRSALTESQIKVLFNGGFSQALGATSTDSSGNPTNSAEYEYCPPGQGSACVAPLADYRFDENTSTTIQDHSGNGNSGTLISFNSGTITDDSWVPGRFGSAVDLDGVNDQVSTTNGISVQGSDGFTLEAWIYPTVLDSTRRTIYEEPISSSTSTRVKLAIDTDNRLLFAVRDDDVDASLQTLVDSATTLTTNKWYHVIAIYDSDRDIHSLFINGAPEIGTFTGNAMDSGNPNYTPRIGGRAVLGQEEPFKGKIDSFKVYNYARTYYQTNWSYNQSQPIGWWKFDECTGTTAYDGSGYGNVGTITPGASGNTSATSCSSGSSTDMWYNGADGKINSALDFDGTDDYVTIPDNDVLDYEHGSSISIEAWVNRQTFNTLDVIAAKDDDITSGGATYNLFIHISDIISFNISGTGGSHINQTSATITSAGWNHIVATYDSATGTSAIYLNGVFQTNGTGSISGTTTNALPFTIGAESDGGNPFDGQIDEVKVYGGALTAAQVKALYNQGAVRFGPN